MRQLEHTHASKLEVQLKEALRCLRGDDAEALTRTLAKISHLGFDVIKLRLEAQRQRTGDLLAELRRLRAERDEAGTPRREGPWNGGTG